jgi:adenylosuccinate synthase
MNKNIDIVLGCNFGDEGKGKVVYSLLNSNKYDLCVRFNGSGNAGHTIYLNNDTKVVVHQLPVGILKQNVYNLISSDCLINIEKLKEEINYVKSFNIDISGRLFISKACHIITNECIEYDKQNNKIGTTGSGIGPTYSQKMLRVGKRVEDCSDLFIELGIEIVDMRKFWQSDFVKNNINDILLEGAQGFELDINWTNHYPYCTSSTCALAGAINTGVSIKNIRHIYGISKIYDTYVGNMEFQPKDNKELELIGKLGNEFGATTGRKRQCNYLNLDTLKEALIINQCNRCIINKTDILEELEIFKLYHNNELKSFKTFYEMRTYIFRTLDFIETIIFSNNKYTV